jgi:hypothetical protein
VASPEVNIKKRIILIDKIELTKRYTMKAKTHLSPWLLVVLILFGTTFTKFHFQEILRIHKTDNTIISIPVSEILSLTFPASLLFPKSTL